MTWHEVRTRERKRALSGSRREAGADRYIAQKIQRDYKAKISSQSKKNFVLEKDVRYLDSRIALLIQNRMALEEVRSGPLPSAWPQILTRAAAK